MRRWFSTLALAFAFVPLAVGAEPPRGASQGEVDEFADEAESDLIDEADDFFEQPASDPGGCPVVCSRYEACIENRCVDACRAGCRVGTFCTASGECEPLPQPDVPILTEEDRQRLSGAVSREKKFVLFADVGGIIAFGLRPGFEYGIQHSVVSRVQFLNTGVMSHAVFQQNEFQRFDWGFGTSVGYRYYEAKWGNLRGFYFGGGLEYTAISVVDRTDNELRTILYTAAPFGEFGYRWVSGDFVYGFGPTLSLRYPIGTGFSLGNREACSQVSACDDIASRRFEGTLNIEIGWFQ